MAQIPALELRKNPVIKVKMSSGDARDMVPFFQMLRFDNGMPNIKDLARKLAESYIKRVRNDGRVSLRVDEITTTVKKIWQSPDEKFFESIIANSPELSKLRVTPKEIIEVWDKVTKSS